MRWRDPFSGLLWIYGAVAFVFLLLAFLMADWLGAWYVRDTTSFALETKMESLEAQIIEQQELLSQGEVLELEKLLRKEFEKSGPYQFIISMNGDLITSFEEIPPDFPSAIPFPEGLMDFSTFHDGKEVNFTSLTTPLEQFNAEVTVALDPSILSSDHNWPAILFTIMASVLGLGLSLSWYLQNRIKARLMDINTTTAAIVNSGDLSRRVKDSNLSGPLAVTVDNINHMLSDVETAMHSTRQQANNIAHDLRTPLTAAYNQLQTAAKRYPELEHSEKLLANLQNTFGLLLQINRLENRSELSALDDMDPYPCVVDSIELYEPVFQEKNQVLQWKVADNLESKPEGLGLVKADHALLMQSVCNLLDNASKYSATGEVIELCIKPSDKYLCIECSNSVEKGLTGGGVVASEAIEEKAFERFYRGDQSRTEEGNGLGLSFVKAAVQAMGGEAGLKLENGKFVVSICLLRSV
ncbi:HAMP domain-containing sensor histidine kinase [uncultured Pseudoteredinibacter sp.]|uniref:sensor histidine kinase n=1 Tax=uncultured Pseudoteredinibacter sp. TaxID=1641701 RepID=UPI002603C4A4|nr:HAMP domain-containing sensor histidine kinase [uncultured Pseudoteredinibacter sp.]